MKSAGISSILLLIIINVFPQTNTFNPPNFSIIKEEISKETSDFYYPVLYERYQAGDTTLSMEEYWFLYYGFTYQEIYSPYGFSPFSDSVVDILDKENPGEDDFHKVIKYSRLVLEEAPFSLREINRLLYAYEHLGDMEMAISTFDRLDKVIGTILNSGDGFTEGTAMYVIRVGHEYDILNVLGFDFVGSQSLTNSGCDYLEVGENEFGIPGFYFNIERVLEVSSKMLE